MTSEESVWSDHPLYDSVVRSERESSVYDRYYVSESYELYSSKRKKRKKKRGRRGRKD